MKIKKYFRAIFLSLFSIFLLFDSYAQKESKHKSVSYFWTPAVNYVNIPLNESKGWELNSEISEFKECGHNHLNMDNQNMKQSVDLIIHRFCDSPKFRFFIINKESEKIFSDKLIIFTVKDVDENKFFSLESFKENGIETLDLSNFIGKNIQLVFTIVNPELFIKNTIYYE